MSKPCSLNAFWMTAGPGLALALAIWGCMESGDPLSVQAGPAALADVSTDVTKTTIEFDDFLECANGGAGEVIHFTGDFTIVNHLTSNRGNPLEIPQHIIDNETIHGEGVGQTTGTIYRLNNAQQFRAQSEPPTESFPLTVQFIVTRNIIASGQGLVGQFVIRQQLTINANGDVTVDSFDIDLVCK
jgi:hypothetical protein